jgi:hypothetical protein
VIQPGSPVGAANPLPSKATMTGTYVANIGSNGLGNAEISFPIPLKTGLPGANVHTAPHEKCPGTYENPQAAQGHLCLYQASEHHGNHAVRESSSRAPSIHRGL